MRRALILFALVLVSSFSPIWAGADGASSDDEPARLVIESGRLVVMMDQSKAALQLLGPNGAHADLAPAAAERAYAFQELVAAVLHYNLLQQQACRAHVAAAAHCTGPYLPVWLKDPPDKDHSAAELAAMIAEASAHLVPFWNEVCPKGRAAAKDDQFCDLE